MSSSKRILWLGWLVMVAAAMLYYPKWKMTRTEATISWDVSGYYLYLPAFFIYNDLAQLSFKPALDEKYYPSSSPYQSYSHPSGNQVMKYTMGLAILYAPFFLVAHVLAEPLGFEADGYSLIYQFFISWSALIWALIGLIFLRRLLLRYFEDSLVAWGLGILILATNYFDYASITGAMSHNYLFSLYALLLYAIDAFYQKKQKRYFLLSCGLLGIMVLIRPTEILGFILFFCWGVHSLDDFQIRIRVLISDLKRILLGLLCFLLAPCLQILYWKLVSGEWLVYSYQDQGFSWLKGHHIGQGLFSYRAGWLVYTPVMILSLLGIWWLWSKEYAMRWAATLFIVTSLYITFAWDEWAYGGSLGQRALVQHYPVMAFPLLAFLTNAFKHKWIKGLMVMFIAICIYYNLWLSHQAHRGGLFEAGMMNRAYFWNTLLRWKAPLEIKKLLDTNESPVNLEDEKQKLISTIHFAPDTACVSKSGFFTLYQGPSIPHSKIKAAILVKSQLKEWDVWQMAQLVIQFDWQQKEIKKTFVRLHRFLQDNERKILDLATLVPARYDSLKIFLWNPSAQPICVEELNLYAQD
jgi:hypothetical protein